MVLIMYETQYHSHIWSCKKLNSSDLIYSNIQSFISFKFDQIFKHFFPFDRKKKNYERMT